MSWRKLVESNFPAASKEAVDQVVSILQGGGPWGLFQEVEYGGPIEDGGGPAWVLPETEEIAREGIECCWDSSNNYFKTFCGRS